MTTPCVVDTPSINLTIDPVTGALTADAILSPDLENRITQRSDGLYANIFRLAYWQQLNDPTTYTFSDDTARLFCGMAIPFTNSTPINIVGHAQAEYNPVTIAVLGANAGEFAHFHFNQWLFTDLYPGEPFDNRNGDEFGPAAAVSGGAINTLFSAGGGVASLGFTLAPGETRVFHTQRDVQRIGGSVGNPSGYQLTPNAVNFSAIFVG